MVHEASAESRRKFNLHWYGSGLPGKPLESESESEVSLILSVLVCIGMGGIVKRSRLQCMTNLRPGQLLHGVVLTASWWLVSTPPSL